MVEIALHLESKHRFRDLPLKNYVNLFLHLQNKDNNSGNN